MPPFSCIAHSSTRSAEFLLYPGGPVNTTDNNSESKRRDESGTSLEKYLLMNEHEKDIEIQKAVTRLQKRIQEILYMLETEKPNTGRSEPDKKKD